MTLSCISISLSVSVSISLYLYLYLILSLSLSIVLSLSLSHSLSIVLCLYLLLSVLGSMISIILINISSQSLHFLIELRDKKTRGIEESSWGMMTTRIYIYLSIYRERESSYIAVRMIDRSKRTAPILFVWTWKR
jgi:hypothetical protein